MENAFVKFTYTVYHTPISHNIITTVRRSDSAHLSSSWHLLVGCIRQQVKILSSKLMCYKQQKWETVNLIICLSLCCH